MPGAHGPTAQERDQASADRDLFDQQMREWVADHGSEQLTRAMLVDADKARAAYVRERAAIDHPLYLVMGDGRGELSMKLRQRRTIVSDRAEQLLALPSNAGANVTWAAHLADHDDPRLAEVGRDGEALAIHNYLGIVHEGGASRKRRVDGAVMMAQALNPTISIAAPGYTLVRSVSMAGLRSRLLHRIGEVMRLRAWAGNACFGEALVAAADIDLDARVRRLAQEDAGIRDLGSLHVSQPDLFGPRDAQLFAAYDIGVVNLADTDEAMQKWATRPTHWGLVADALVRIAAEIAMEQR